jgi:hypothetical protein
MNRRYVSDDEWRFFKRLWWVCLLALAVMALAMA